MLMILPIGVTSKKRLIGASRTFSSVYLTMPLPTLWSILLSAMLNKVLRKTSSTVEIMDIFMK